MIRILLFLVILAAALMLVTQITLSSDLPRRLLAAQMERTLGARMDVDSMKTSWNGRTRLTNLRLTIDALDEAQWLVYTANLHTRPPMPDYQLRAMREEDRRAIYRFIRSLGPAGAPAPAALPPGQTPPPPHFQLVLPTG